MHEKTARYQVVRDTVDTYALPFDAPAGAPFKAMPGLYDVDNVCTVRRLCLCPMEATDGKDMIPALLKDGLTVDVDCPATVGDVLSITVSWE